MFVFSLPGIEEYHELNIWFLKLQKDRPDVFFDRVLIDNIYGSFNGIIWNGGRNIFGERTPLDRIEKIIEGYKKYNVNIRFSFTNLLLGEEHLKDEYSNKVLDLINKHNCEITVASDCLKEYITNKYPSIQLISSTTKCIEGINDLNLEIKKGYKLVVLDFRKNADIEFLEKISQKDRIELLLNEDCYATCKHRKRHYLDTSKNILMNNKMPDTEIYCSGKYNNFYESLGQSTTITYKGLYEKYSKMGFSHFKLIGRLSDHYNVMESYIYYLIKPEYRNYIRLELLKSRVVRG